MCGVLESMRFGRPAGLEGFHCCLAHSSLRALFPKDDGSWEEALLVVV